MSEVKHQVTGIFLEVQMQVLEHGLDCWQDAGYIVHAMISLASDDLDTDGACKTGMSEACRSSCKEMQSDIGQARQDINSNLINSGKG